MGKGYWTEVCFWGGGGTVGGRGILDCKATFGLLGLRETDFLIDMV